MGTAKRKNSPRKRRSDGPANGFKVTLPGKAYQRGTRWWWSVKLPGEEKARARPLKSAGAKTATSDAAEAERIALEMWEQAIREQAQSKARLESSETVERLKAQFLEKVRHFTEIVQNATARAEAEAQARTEAEARLRELTEQAPPQPPIQASPATGPQEDEPLGDQSCDCCGEEEIPAAQLHRIDSGQLLCPTCLAALRHDAAKAD